MLTLPCPAKLNLFLRVLGRRADGYHELQTLFQLLNFGDELRFEPSDQPNIQLYCDLENLANEDNLVYRAAKLLQAQCRPSKGASLHLSKRLPAGGGIGGGSSDAATTLVGLNQLWNTGLNEDELADLGARLGADVPVFIRGRSALAQGIGEKLTPLDLPETWYVVLVPKCSVSTASIFAHKDLTRDSQAIKVRASIKGGGSKEGWRNDCQPLVERLYPQVKEAIAWLNNHGQAQLTGTGACVFAAMSSEAQAEDVLALRPAQLGGFVAQGVNHSPLHQALPD